MAVLRVLLACTVALLPGYAQALCTATCTCTVSTTAVAFGSYFAVAGDATGVGNVRITCAGVVGLLVPFDVALGAGANAAPSFDRRMASGTQRLRYNLYTQAGTVWGDGTGTTRTVSGSVTVVLLGGTSVDLPVYGRIAGGQAAAPGTYGDTVTITVTYF